MSNWGFLWHIGISNLPEGIIELISHQLHRLHQHTCELILSTVWDKVGVAHMAHSSPSKEQAKTSIYVCVCVCFPLCGTHLKGFCSSVCLSGWWSDPPKGFTYTHSLTGKRSGWQWVMENRPFAQNRTWRRGLQVKPCGQPTLLLCHNCLGDRLEEEMIMTFKEEAGLQTACNSVVASQSVNSITRKMSL